jgi:hypothetical protein
MSHTSLPYLPDEMWHSIMSFVPRKWQSIMPASDDVHVFSNHPAMIEWRERATKTKDVSLRRSDSICFRWNLNYRDI